MSDRPDLKAWIGREQRRVDWITPTHVAAWNATLDRDEPFPREGDPVPPCFHWTLFTPLARESELGPDGHAKRGCFLPPVALPRRMWAGSRILFLQPLRVGERVEQTSAIEKVEEKTGKAGSLVFVTVKHAISGGSGLAIEDEHDIVYREAPKPGAAAAAAPVEPAPRGSWEREIVPTDTLLFRYSALTFNGHRIHYDRRYVTTEEGYAGLVVHGPLIATLMLDLLRRSLPAVTIESFRFRGLRPTVDVSPFAVRGAPGDSPGHVRLWSTDNQGQLGMEGEAWTR